MNQRVAVDELQCTGCLQDAIIIAAEQSCGLDNEDGSEALTAVECAVAHRIDQPGWPCYLACKRNRVQYAFQNGFNPAALFRQVLLELNRHEVLQTVFPANAKFGFP